MEKQTDNWYKKQTEWSWVIPSKKKEQRKGHISLIQKNNTLFSDLIWTALR